MLLSGTAFDSTAGLEAIKKQGGMTVAQNASSAKYPQMPQHAITAGYVDRILPTQMQLPAYEVTGESESREHIEYEVFQ